MPLKKEPPAASSSPKDELVSRYEKDQKVLCRHIDGLHYEAKIIEVTDEPDGVYYTVHYNGWNTRHDERIVHEHTLDRFIKLTPENLAKAKAEVNERRKEAKTKKSSIRAAKQASSSAASGDDSNKSKGERTSSRASTPSVEKLPLSSRASVSSEQHPAAATAVTLNTTPSSASQPTSTKKRKAPDAHVEPPKEYTRRKEVRIDIPEPLKEILVDDGDLINRQMKLTRLPARITAAKMIEKYGEMRRANAASTKGGARAVDRCIESSIGIRDYFDAALGTQLLYKFERPQYADLIEENGGSSSANDDDENSSTRKPSMAEFYGFVHLLRLFVRFGSMMSYTQWNERSVQTIVDHMHDFIGFVNDHRDQFFNQAEDYETASPEYQKRAWSS